MSLIEYVFLDGGHDYETVKNDLINCSGVVERGGKFKKLMITKKLI